MVNFHVSFKQNSGERLRATGPSCLFCFDLILYVPSTIFQLNKDGSFCVELSYRINVSCWKTTTQWRQWGSSPRPLTQSQVKHSITEPLRSHEMTLIRNDWCLFLNHHECLGRKATRWVCYQSHIWQEALVYILNSKRYAHFAYLV